MGEFAQHHKQFFDGLRGEYRSRFIQNQYRRACEQSADDFHPLHLAHAQGMNGALGINIQPVFGGTLDNALGDLRQRLAFQAQPHIFGDRHGVKQIEMLKHHTNAQRPRHVRIAYFYCVAVDANRARVGLHRAVDDFHQRGFTRTVFPQYGVNFTRRKGQRYIAIRHHTRISLGDAEEF